VGGGRGPTPRRVVGITEDTLLENRETILYILVRDIAI
jgi:hypothetical protein